MGSRYTKEGLEKKVDELDTKIDTILTNHLPHLSQDIKSLETKINIYTVINIGGIILGLIASKFFI